MRSRIFLASCLVSCLAPTLVPAQITVTAVASGAGLNATFIPSVPPGTDLTAGFTSPLISFSISGDQTGIDARLTSRGQNGGSSSGTVDVLITSARPMLVDVSLAESTFEGPPIPLPTCPAPTASSSATLQSGGTLPSLYVDAAGVMVRLDAQARTVFNQACLGGLATADAQVSVRPSTTAVSSYGVTCGTSFVARSTLDGFELTISNPNALPFGVLLVGKSRLSVPTPWGCTLLSDYFAALPVLRDAQGSLTVSNVFPPPVIALTMQAGTFGMDPSGQPVVSMSAGLQFH